MTDGSNEKIQVVIEAGAMSAILKFLEVEDTTILIPALRVVGNIVSGNDNQVSFLDFDHSKEFFFFFFSTCFRVEDLL